MIGLLSTMNLQEGACRGSESLCPLLPQEEVPLEVVLRCVRSPPAEFLNLGLRVYRVCRVVLGFRGFIGFHGVYRVYRVHRLRVTNLYNTK